MLNSFKIVKEQDEYLAPFFTAKSFCHTFLVARQKAQQQKIAPPGKCI
jgi:hypothetical protein